MPGSPTRDASPRLSVARMASSATTPTGCCGPTRTGNPKGNRVLKAIKGGLKKQSVIVRGNNQSRVSVEFFAAHPTYKLMGIVPVETKVNPDALAQLLSPVKVKQPKQPKQAKIIDPRSVAGFLAYVDATAQRAA